MTTTIFGGSAFVRRKLIPLTVENEQAAQRNGALANTALRPRLREWSQRLTVLVNSTAPVRARIRELYRIADEFTATAAPYAVCKRGCSACCYMATMVAEPEAQLMAHSLRIKMRQPTEWPYYIPGKGVNRALQDKFAESFHGGHKPCPFLVNDACGIYEHRPLACRIHLNMAANAEPCEMDAARETAMLDVRTFDDALALICRTFHFTDIREYFPNGLKRK